jgi:hypothetical protein
VKKITVKFVDFWTDMDKPEGNYFYELLSQRYTVEFSDDPEIVFYSCYGKEYLKYKCPRIFYSPENWRPDFTGCDFAITFDYNQDPRHFRLPLWALYYIGYVKQHGFPELDEELSEQELVKRWKGKSKFCCFIVSNPTAKKRIDFFQKLNEVKSVDSAGRHLNNIGYFLDGGTFVKMDFIKDYRFVISFENSSSVGYTTEKLIEPLLIGAIPIYWGNPAVGKEFNKRRMLYYDDFPTEEALIERILKIENDPQEALCILKEKAFAGEKFSIARTGKDLLDFLVASIESMDGRKPVAQRPLNSMWHSFNMKWDKVVNKLKLS